MYVSKQKVLHDDFFKFSYCDRYIRQHPLYNKAFSVFRFNSNRWRYCKMKPQKLGNKDTQ